MINEAKLIIVNQKIIQIISSDSSMRILMYLTPAAAFQKIQVSSQRGLLHMTLIKIYIAPGCEIVIQIQLLFTF